MKSIHKAIIILALAATQSANGEQSAGLTSAELPKYAVSCQASAHTASECVVDDGTYAGWGFYSRYCSSCHGDDVQGSATAPSLIARLNDSVDYDRINYVLVHGHQGDTGDMPAWGDNRAVVEHIDNLYRYLKARADSVLPPGAPELQAD